MEVRQQRLKSRRVGEDEAGQIGARVMVLLLPGGEEANLFLANRWSNMELVAPAHLKRGKIEKLANERTIRSCRCSKKQVSKVFDRLRHSLCGGLRASLRN